MPSPTSALGVEPVLATAEASIPMTGIAIEGNRGYTVVHRGKDDAGDDDLTMVVVGYGVAPSAWDYAAGAGKFNLEAGESIYLEPLSQAGANESASAAAKIYLLTDDGAAPNVSIIPGKRVHV